MFRDQTDATALKVKALEYDSSTPTSPKGNAVVPSDSRALACPSRSDNPLSSSAIGYASVVDSLAESIFFDQYVFGHDDSPANYSDIEFIPTVYGQATRHGMLVEVIHALGLGVLAHARHETLAAVASRKKYASALRLTNAALSDPDQATTDETITTVMLLAQYEVCT